MFILIYSRSRSVVLNLFYAISHFATPNLNIPLLHAMSFGTLLSTPQQSATTPRYTVGALKLAYWALCIRYKPSLQCSELPTLCFKNIQELCEVLNVRVTAGQGLPRHRRNQQSGGALPVFVWGHRKFLQNKV